MSHAFHCPCGARYRVKPELVGKRVRCRECGEVVRVGSAGDVPATPSPRPVASTPASTNLWPMIAGGTLTAALVVGAIVFAFSRPGDTTPEPSQPNEVASTPQPSATGTNAKPATTVAAIDRAALPADQPDDSPTTDVPDPELLETDAPEVVTVAEPMPGDEPNDSEPEPVAVVEASTPDRPSQPAAAPASTSSESPSDRVTRTKADVLALIDKVGRTPPDWYDATPLNYPKTLDLSWPQKPPGGWNNQKNVGQFLWDVINPNPGRWKQGVRFMHHMLGVHQKDRAQLAKVMNELGRMYHELLQDHARAAFWYQQAGVGKGSRFDSSRNGAHLAECYWRLGNQKMAEELLAKLPPSLSTIRLWGAMGETEKSVDLARRSLSGFQFPAALHLLIGDAYRTDGQFSLALAAYQDALREAQRGGHKRQDQFRARAQASIAAIKAFELLDPTRVPDGTYSASSIGYEDQVHVAVDVRGGRITDVRVTKHREKQFYSSINDTTAKIVREQGVKGVDATSGATITSEAIINATAKALADAVR